jgi:acetylornithine deacetylase
MQKIHPDTGIDLEAGFALPALTPEADGAAETLVRRLTGDNGRHVVSYGTEGSQFQARGYSTVICGPGDIAQAHQPDEFLSLEQLAAGEAFIDRLLDSVCR